jgi:N-acetylneuraminic acid mutarotase
MPKTVRAAAVACYQGNIYVAGGIVSNVISNTFYIYDIATNTWSKGMNLPDKVWGAALGAWQGKLYLVGGSHFGGVPYPPVSQVDVYNIASGRWTAGDGTPMPVASGFFASTQVGAYLYVVGGISGDPNQNVNQTQRYDMSTDTWASGPTFTNARALGGLAATSNHLYMLGGDLNGGTAFDASNLVDVLELSSWPEGAWAEGPALPAANIYPATTCTENLAGGEIWNVGGLDVTPVWVVTDTVYYLPVGEGCP